MNSLFPWKVTSNAVRPAGKDGECFYCNEKLGVEHKRDCVIRSRTVICNITIRLVRDVPEDWDEKQIDFYMNESSSCTDNLLNEIKNMLERVQQSGRCTCGMVEGKYIGEATMEDEDDQCLYIETIQEKES